MRFFADQRSLCEQSHLCVQITAWGCYHFIAEFSDHGGVGSLRGETEWSLSVILSIWQCLLAPGRIHYICSAGFAEFVVLTLVM